MRERKGTFVTVGRHSFTASQRTLLERVGLVAEVHRFQSVRDTIEVVEKARELGASAIVVQGLPLPLLAQLLQHASRAGVPVYAFRTEAIGLFPSREEAERAGADIVIPSSEGSFRALRTVALQRLVKIQIVAEDVVSL